MEVAAAGGGPRAGVAHARSRGAELPEQRLPAPTWLDAPPVTEQQDSNATVTALAEFARCPRRYYLGHYLGFDGRSRRVAGTGRRGGSAGQ